MRTARLAAIVAAAILATDGAGAAAPVSFQLVFDGKHNAALLHEGTFTTSSSSCSSGTAADVAIDEATLTATREFTCSSGASFTAKVGPLPAEHGGSGTWQIVSGTGQLADLRGEGTFTSVLLTGNPNDPETITFRSTWAGVSDLDATAPAVRVTHWSVKKLARPKRAYKVRLALSLTDNGGGPVSYVLELADPKKPSNPFVVRLEKTSSGSVTRTFRIRVGKHTRRIRLKVDATDAVGNESAFAKTFRLR
jgi:hypothetical protein